MSVSVTGDKAVLRELKKLGLNLDRATEEAVYGTAQAVRGTAIKSIQKVSQGEVVTRTTQGGAQYQHTASRPGDAPNTDTGALVRSINVEPQQPAHEMYVGTTLGYGPHLEHGTRNMEARPWLFPALESHSNTLRRELQKAIDRQIAMSKLSD